MNMKCDDSAKAFETIFYHNGQFGFFQRRLFILVSVLQAFTWSILLYIDCIHQHQHAVILCPTETISYPTNESFAVTQPFINSTQNFNMITTIPSMDVLPCLNPQNETVESWTVPVWFQSINNDTYNIEWLSQGSGIIIGAFIGGFSGDLLGRKIPMFVMYGLMSLAQGAIAVFEDWTVFLILRVLIGCFAGGFLVISTVLMVEFMGQDWRDVCVCACLWSMGVVIVAFESYLTQHWRYLAIVTSSTCLLSTGSIFICPESFRWYSCRERFAESEAAIREMVSCNGNPVTDLTSLYDKAKLAVLNTMHKRPHTYLDLIHSRKNLQYTCTIMFIWFTCCVIYRCLLERVSSLTGHMYTDMCLSYVVDLPVIFTAVIINKCIGRRWCLFLYATSSGFGLMCILILNITNSIDKDEDMITGISLFGKLGVAASLALCLLITVEIFPTTVRCMGLSVGVISAVIGLAVGRQFYVTFTQNFHYMIPYLGYGVSMTLVGISALVFKETSNKPLPDLLPSRHRMIGMKEVTRLVNAWDTL